MRLALASVLVLACTLVTAASATFRGQNGAIIAQGPPRDISQLATLVYVPLDGTDPRVLGLGQSPIWSPRGRFLAFASWHKIYVATTDGYRLTSHRRLIKVPERIQLWELAWFPGGRRLAYVTLDMKTDTSDIHSLSVSNGRHRSRLTFAKPGWANEWPAVSPSGDWIAYTTCGPREDACNLRVMRSNGSDQHTIVSAPPWRAIEPHWSPDGAKIGFNLCGLHSCVPTIYDVRTRMRRRLPGRGFEAFAPDGKGVLLFDRVRGRRECGLGLFATDLRGRHRRLLPGDCLDFADWQALP